MTGPQFILGENINSFQYDFCLKQRANVRLKQENTKEKSSMLGVTMTTANVEI